MKNIILSLIVGICIGVGGMVLYSFKPSLPSAIGVAPPKYAEAPTTTVPCKTVEAMADKVKKEVGLPAQVQADKQSKVLAVVEVPQSDNPLFATSLLHLDTGVGEIHFTPQPLPWLAFNKRWRFSAHYGINDKESGVVMGGAQYEAIQIKGLHISAIGQVDTSSRYFVGVGVTW